MTKRPQFTEAHYRSLARGTDDNAVEKIRQFADEVMGLAGAYRSLSEQTAETEAAGGKVVDIEKLRGDLHEITQGAENAMRQRLREDDTATFSSAEIGLVADLEIADVKLNSDPDSRRRADLLKQFDAGRENHGAATVRQLMRNRNAEMSDGSRFDRARVKVDHAI